MYSLLNSIVLTLFQLYFNLTPQSSVAVTQLHTNCAAHFTGGMGQR